MSHPVFIHEQTREFICPAQRHVLELKLLCAAKAAASCRVIYWNRLKGSEQTCKEAQLDCFARDNDFDYYACTLVFDEPARYLRYYFVTEDGKKARCLSAYGLSDNKPESGFFEYLYANENDVFSVPGWAKEALFYQVFPERFFNGERANDPEALQSWNELPTRENFFGGDIRGVIKKLDHISGLGANVIYLNPIFASPSNHKYDTTDYFAVDPTFGTLDDLKELVGSCHSRGIRVVLDGVFNHCGFYFAPFQDVIEKGEASKYRDWFYIDKFPVSTDPPNYECVGYYRWMPKMRLAARQVREFFLRVGTYWIEQADIDGWRLDVCDEVDYTFWQEFRKSIKQTKRDAVLIGETWKDGRDLLRGDQMDSVMNYLFRDAVAAYIARREITEKEFDSRINRMRGIYGERVCATLYNLIGSHDTERFLTLCGGDTERLMLAAGFQLFFPGMPAIYYGDETGMSGENDPGCRRPMDWENINDDVLEFYKRLIAIRKGCPALVHGSYRTVVCGPGVYGFARKQADETAYVVLNNSDAPQRVSIPSFENEGTAYCGLLWGQAYMSRKINGKARFYNADINEYKSFFEMEIPKNRLEIIKIKEEK